MKSGTFDFEIEGYKGTVIIPENFNGKWLWKTEFFHAFEALEVALFNKGYARVYFGISDKYGSPKSIELMYKFYQCITSELSLNKECILIGFSRGGLYAFNFAIAHPECVSRMYLDAPVLDLRTWPRRNKKYNEIELYKQVLREYKFDGFISYYFYKKYPVKMLKKFFELNIPTLLVAGEGDTTVSFKKNSLKMIKYAKKKEIGNFYYYIKCGDTVGGGDHHPHSFGNVGIKLIYGFDSPKTFLVRGNVIGEAKTIDNDVKVIEWFFGE